jgi:hypothetical protein
VRWDRGLVLKIARPPQFWSSHKTILHFTK